MAKILSFVDHRQRIMEGEDQRLPPDYFLEMNIEANLFRPALEHLKNRKLTRYQAKRLCAILSQAFGINNWETEPNNTLRLEHEWSLTKSSFLARSFEKGELLIHEIVSSIQQGIFSRYRAIHIIQVAQLWYKEVLQ